jgi:hypothetical protein
MGALVIASLAAVVGVGLIIGVIGLAALGVAGTKVVNAAHDGGTWLHNRHQQHRSRSA